MAMDNFAENIRDKSPPVTDPETLAVALSNVGTMSPRLRKLYDDSAAALRAQANEIDRLHDRLRQALVDFADVYMDDPVTESERAAVAARHQRKPRVTTAAELKQQAKSDTSCVGAFARARPGKA